jgi:hypothetical protein
MPIAQAVELIFMTGVSVRGDWSMHECLQPSRSRARALTCVKIPEIEG